MNESELVTEQVLEVHRSTVGETQLRDLKEADVAEGQVVLRIDKFAITANNISYAVFGDMLGYWDFFPSDVDSETWGRVPAMGWAEVVESRVDGINVGARYYGWFPMASSVTMTATPTRDGFRDDGVHRQAHAPVYRAYVDTKSDPFYDDADDGEDRHALLRGLFLTGFLADEFFADAGGSGAPSYFGADRVIVLSASSKTAIGFAQRAFDRGISEIIGVTSAGNVDFVEALGYYHTVITYDEIDSIDDDIGTVSIDMAGNPAFLAAVHSRLGDRLLYSMTVGRSHHDAPPSEATGDLAGPAPQMFFAPTEVTRRLEDWGRDDYGRKTADALETFVEGSRAWMTVERRDGSSCVVSAWADVHDGDVSPSIGLVASFSSQ
jgi:NADPH:quinone reductase-like Zn-dependent oxidoreductase